MNGLTGLDIERAKHDIETFDSMASTALNNIHNCFYNLYTVLNEHWASPVAVQFTSKNSQQINELNENMATTIAHIVNGAISAAENLSNANGISFPLKSEKNFASATGCTGVPCEPCKDQLNGVTGMDVEGVKQALNVFRTTAINALEEIVSLPNVIHFYDPNGDMVGEYNRGVDSFKQQYHDLIEQTYTEMRSYIETEADNILLAKQNATQTLNG